MSNLRQAAQRALKAMEDGEWRADMVEFSDALIALRSALAEHDRLAGIEAIEKDAGIHVSQQAEHEQEPISLNNNRLTQYPDGSIGLGKPTHKPQTTHWEGCEAVHPECKTEQTVATWENKYGMKEWQVHAIRAGWMPAPTPRKPLTDEEIDALSRTMVKGDRSVNWLCRAIERSHGIGEQHDQR